MKISVAAVALLALLALAAGLLVAGPALAQSEGSVRQYIERTGEVVAQAAEAVQLADSPRARRILDEAQTLHKRSIELEREGRPQQALLISRRARAAAEQALRFARESHGQEDRFQQRFERFREFRDQILDRARESGDERALRFVRESEEQAQRAAEQHRQGNFAMALKLMEPADALLARAARLLFEGGSVRLEPELERTRAFLDRAAEQIAAAEGAGGAPGGETARDLLESAREALARAEALFQRGQPVQSLHALRLARRLAAQAVDAGGESIQPETVARQLALWDERFDAVAERVADSNSEQAKELLSRARHHRERAGTSHKAGNHEQALRQLKAAFDLLNEANELAR